MYNYPILTLTGNVGFNFKLFYNAIKIGTWCSVVKDHMPKVVLSWFIALTRTTETLIEKKAGCKNDPSLKSELRDKWP